jgi:hypothetical protein
LALFHTVWAVLVAIGVAQALLDFVYSIHFLSNPFVIGDFNLTTAVILVVVTGIVGYVSGWVFAFLWSYLHKRG